MSPEEMLKELENLRCKVADLEAENSFLRRRSEETAPSAVVFSPVEETDRERSDDEAGRMPREPETTLRSGATELRDSNATLLKEIAARTQADISLKEHFAVPERILEKSADGICVCRTVYEAPYVLFSHWNSRMSEITGYTLEEINQSGWHQTMYPDPGFWSDANGKSVRMRLEDDMRAEEWTVTTKSGIQKQLSISSLVIERGNESLQVLFVIQDVTERRCSEEVLKDRDRRYHMLAMNISDVIWSTDLNLNLTYLSPSLERMHGWTVEEAISFSPDRYLTAGSIEYVAKTLADELALSESPEADPHRVMTLELEQFRKDGTVFWTEVTARFLYDDARRPVGIVGATRDISDRKRSEEALKEEREFSEALIRSVPGLLYLYDETGHMVRWNKQHEDLTGYSAEEMRGMHFLDWFGGREPATSHIAQRVHEVMTKGRGEAEADMITKDGRAIPFYFTGVKLTIAGKPYFTGVGIDITERKRAEEELKKSKTVISSILNSVPQSIFWKDRNGVYLGCNEAFARAVGLRRPQEIVGKTDYDLPWSREEADAYRADDLEVISLNRAKRHIIEPLRQADGARLWIDTTKVPLTDGDGAVYGVLGVYDDITDRKKTEEAVKSIVEGVSGKIGCKFFESSVVHFANLLEADFTFIGEIFEGDQGPWVRTLGYSAEGKLKDNFDYCLTGAPCEKAVEHEICTFPSGVAKLFPEDAGLREKGMEGYVGVCLYDSRRRPVGVMASMYLRPVQNVEFAESVLRIFASRAAAEIERKRSEEALRQSEATLRTLLQAAPVGIGQVSSDRTVQWSNELLSSMLGYSREELAGKSAAMLYETEEEFLRVGRVKHPEIIKRGMGSVETRFKRKDGTSFDVLLSSAAIVPGEFSRGLVFTVMDITERRRADEEERLYAHRLEALVKLGQMIDAPLHTLAAFAMEEAVRLTRSSIGYVAFTDRDEKTLTMHAWSQEAMRQCAIQNKPLVYPVEETGLWGEAVRQRRPIITNDYTSESPWKKGAPAGHVEILRHMNVPIFDQGRIVVVAGVGNKSSDYDDNDIRQLTLLMEGMWGIVRRQRADQQLKRLGAAVEQAGESIVITDRTGNIIYANPAFEETTGYSLQEVLGKSAALLKSDKERPPADGDLWSTIKQGAVWRGRLASRKKDGSTYVETATISPIKDKAGSALNYVMVGRDVTSEITLQKQLVQAQKMEAIGTLAGGIAHDFNNLLQAILGYSDLLLMNKGTLDPDRKKLEVILHAARDGADLVERILTFCRKSETKVRPVDLNEEVRRVEKLLRRTLPKMIQIDLLLARDLRIVDADPAQIEQVILNLGVNARHAMPEGGRLIIETRNVSLRDGYLSAHIGAEPGRYVLLAVSDNGIGIEPDVMDRIFDPFFTTKTNGEGTGLGLAIVHGIVTQHSGYIRCYSEPGIGTSFRVYFPISSAEIVADQAMTREMPAFGSETILLVDDDDRVREMAREMIEMAGYQALTARSGEEALAVYKVHEEEISMVILDLIMPGMGGKRCLEELLRHDPGVKVLLASGYSSEGLNPDQKGSGAMGFMNKPYDAKDILGAIRQVLDHGRL